MVESTMDLIPYALNYGFAGMFCILFWRFITSTQRQQTESLRELSNSLDKLAERLE